MDKLKGFFTILFLFFSLNINAQEYNTNLALQVADISSINLTQFLNFSDINFDELNESIQVIMRLTVNSDQPEVTLIGSLYWESPEGDFSGNVFDFTTDPVTLEDIGGGFYSLSITNLDFGSGQLITIFDGETNSDLIEENAKRGKLSGSYALTIFAADNMGNRISENAYWEFTPTNIVPNFRINSPSESDQNISAEGFQVIWDIVNGAKSYLAVISDEYFDSREDAASGSPFLELEINAPAEGATPPSVAIISPATTLRDLVPGNSYYLGVFAVDAQNIYYPAENNSMKITMAEQQSQGSGSTSSSLSKSFEISGTGDDDIIAPDFFITEPLPEFTYSLPQATFTVTWDQVTGATEYRFFMNYIGAEGSTSYNLARADNNRAIIPGVAVSSPAILTQNSFVFNNGYGAFRVTENITDTWNDGDYVVLGIYAVTPKGTFRTKNLVLGKVSKPAGENGDDGNDDQQQIINNVISSINDVTGATDENGNAIDSQALQNLIQQLQSGQLEGTLKKVNN